MKNNDEKLIEAILKNLLLFAAVKIKFINFGNIHAINIAMFMR